MIEKNAERLLIDYFPIMQKGLNPDVQAYLNEHLFRSFSQKSTVSVRQTTLRPRQLRRRMSCKGAIKKTRSINADSKLKMIFQKLTKKNKHQKLICILSNSLTSYSRYTWNGGKCDRA